MTPGRGKDALYAARATYWVERRKREAAMAKVTGGLTEDDVRRIVADEVARLSRTTNIRTVCEVLAVEPMPGSTVTLRGSAAPSTYRFDLPIVGQLVVDVDGANLENAKAKALAQYAKGGIVRSSTDGTSIRWYPRPE